MKDDLTVNPPDEQAEREGDEERESAAGEEEGHSS